MIDTVLFYTAIMAIIDSIMMTLLKLKQTTYLTGSYILPLAMAIYSLEPLLFFNALSFQGIGIINALWNALSSILIALIGCLLFGEKISSTNWLGILLCSTGILLIQA
jgi:multidrug transporter EmrE-like cation transporter